MNIRKATGNQQDTQAITALAMLLFTGHAYDALAEEMRGYAAGTESAVFLAEEDGQTLAFAQCGLRHDYVEGTQSSPVGYLEGIYVREGTRRAGVASALVSACEQWAKALGCTEFASDCPMDNALSIAFHLGAGFTEANRLVCFVKEI